MLEWNRDKRQWRTNDGVIFTAYRTAKNTWVGSRQAPGAPEEFLRAAPSPDYVKSLWAKEQPQQKQLL